MPLAVLRHPVALCMVLCGVPGTPENTIGAPGSMLTGARVPGGKLDPRTSTGAATVVLYTRCGMLNVKPRGGASGHTKNVAHCREETKTSMVWAWPALTMVDVASTGP